MGRDRYFLKKNTGSRGKEYRHEQVKCTKILRKILGNSVKQEYEVKRLTLDGYPTRGAILDIAIPSKKLAIRLMGGIHTSSKTQKTKDEYQKEALKQDGWRVIDFWEDEMPNLWSIKKDEETFKLAEEEVWWMIDNA